MRDWEFCEKLDTLPVNIKGSLRKHIVFWEEELKPSQFVLNVLRHGYILPFIKIPDRQCTKNNASSLRHKTFVSQAITELLEAGFITQLDEPAYCCSPLTVSEKGKLRLVLDLRNVNPFLFLKTFRYDDLKTVAELFETLCSLTLRPVITT